MSWCDSPSVSRISSHPPSTPPVFYGLCLFLAFRPVPPTPPYRTLNHHLSAPRSRQQRATALTADRCVRTGFVGGVGIGATEAGFFLGMLRGLLASPPHCCFSDGSTPSRQAGSLVNEPLAMSSLYLRA